jgi:hypothetical protein
MAATFYCNDLIGGCGWLEAPCKHLRGIGDGPLGPQIVQSGSGDSRDTMVRLTTPKQAAQKAAAIVVEPWGPEQRHVKLDFLLCEVLAEHGFDELVDIYKRTGRRYY